jgi:hypothetical protein
VFNGRIDFNTVREQSRLSIELVLDRYLPAGRWVGSEYVVRNPIRGDANPGSFKINRSSCGSSPGKLVEQSPSRVA